jgi:hypothetical protein
LPSQPFPKDLKGLTDLSVGTSDSEAALDRVASRGGCDPSAGDVGDLFEATSLRPDDMTGDGVRNDDGQ